MCALERELAEARSLYDTALVMVKQRDEQMADVVNELAEARAENQTYIDNAVFWREKAHEAEAEAAELAEDQQHWKDRVSRAEAEAATLRRMLDRLALEYEQAASEFTIDWDYDSWRDSPRKDIKQAVERADQHLADLRARAEAGDGDA